MMVKLESCTPSTNIIILDAIALDSNERIFKDHLLWSALSIIGINVKKNDESRMKCVIWTARILIFLAILHLFGVTFAYFTSDLNKHPATFMVYLYVFSLLWIFAQLRMKRIYSLLPHIYGIRHLLRVPTDRSTLSFTCMLVEIFIFSLAYTITSVCRAVLLDDEHKTYWFYSVVIESQSARYTLYSLGYFSYCGLLTFTPLLITLVICSVEYRCFEILEAINKQLQKLTGTNDGAGVPRLADLYLKTIDVLQKLRDTLSPLLFIHLLFSVMGMFMCLSRVILFPNMDDTGRIGSIQTVVDFFVNVSMMLYQVAWGSVIPEGVEQIRDTARIYVGINKNYENKNDELFFLLEKIGNVEPVYMTAWGFVKIQKKLILGVLGALFTYGLLIINMKL